MRAYYTVKETGVKFVTGFNRRFDKNFQRIVDHCKNGDLGDEQLLKINSHDPEPPSLNILTILVGSLWI